MTVTHAHDILTEAFDYAIEELNGFLERLTEARTISVERHDGGRYHAVLSGRQVFPYTSDLNTVIRFVRAFAKKNAGVRVDEDSIEYWRCEREFGDWSVRVPDNVVPIGGREQ